MSEMPKENTDVPSRYGSVFVVTIYVEGTPVCTIY